MERQALFLPQTSGAGAFALTGSNSIICMQGSRKVLLN
jgi:hypothetical protein